jgi:hypothetical protein
MEDDKTMQSEMTTESVEDLELTNQQAEGTKAGSSSGANLTAFAGQTIRLRIASTNNQGTL